MEGMETETNGGGGGAAVATKRQRRPSVRLGDIGGGTVTGESHHLHHFYFSDSHPPRAATKPQPKSRPLRNPRSNKQALAEDANVTSNNSNTNSDKKKKRKTSSSGGSGSLENGEDVKEGDFGGGDVDGVAIGSSNIRGDLKSKRGISNAKGAVRSNWASSSTLKQNQNDGVTRNFEPLNSDVELDEEEEEKEDHQLMDEDDDNASPMHSFDNDDNGNNLDNVNDNGRRRRGGVQIMEEMDPPSDVRTHGVRAWLNKLGLKSYAPVFEIHEVDAEVLPLLTLVDLKDMGISAVGSRRKMYCSIQKLNKGFS